MAAEHATYYVHHDLKTGFTFGSTGGTLPGDNQPEVLAIPGELIGDSSINIVFVLWQDFANTNKLDCTGLTATLYARPKNSPVVATSLVVGSVGGAGNNEITCTVPKDTIVKEWSVYSETLVWLEVADATIETKIQQAVSILNLEADSGLLEGDMSRIPVTTLYLTGTYQIINAPGWHQYFCDVTSGGFTITLPTFGTYDGQRIEIFVVGTGTNVLTVDLDGQTIGTHATNLSLLVDDSIDLREYNSGSVVNANPIIRIT